MRYGFFIGTLLTLALLVCGCAAAAPTATPAPTALPAPTAVPPTAAPAKSGTLRFYDLVNVDVRDIPMQLALDDLRSQGYTVEVTLSANSTIMAEALASGAADVALFNAQTAWAAISKGATFRTIIQFTGGTTVIAAKNEIQDCKDLAGKRIGAANATGANPALLKRYLAENCGGVEPELIVIGEAGPRAAAFASGDLDATFLPGEEFLKIDDQTPGKFHVLIPLSRVYPDVLVDSLHARQEWLAQNPQLAHDLVLAILKANRAVIDNPQLLYDESVKRLKLEPAVAKKIADVHLQNGIWSPNGGITSESVQNTLAFYSEAAGLKKGMKVEDVADLSILNTVLQEIGKK